MSRWRAFLLALVCLAAGPTVFATIWGPAGVPPLGTYRDVSFYSCATGTQAFTGYEEWDCLRNLTQVGSPAKYAVVTDIDCETEQELSVTYYCKNSQGWQSITATQFQWCWVCPPIGN